MSSTWWRPSSWWPAWPASAINGDGASSSSLLRSRERLSTDESTALLAEPEAPQHASKRLISLDQFRGFVIFYSLCIPICGWLDASPPVFKHNNSYFSLADATMPMFYLAIGHAMELTLAKLKDRRGWWAVYKKQLIRSFTLYFVAIYYHGVDGFSTWSGENGMQQNWWEFFILPLLVSVQTLTIIAVSQLIVLPVIARPAWWRALYICVLSILYFVGSYLFWFEQVWSYVDGGWFGTLSWGTVMLAGSLMNDYALAAQRSLNQLSGGDVKLAQDDDQSSRGGGGGGTTILGANRARLLLSLKWAAGLALVAVVLMAAGVGMSALPQQWSPVCFNATTRTVIECNIGGQVSVPFKFPDPNILSIFTMSQRSVSIAIQLFGAGVGMFVYAVIFVICEGAGVYAEFLTMLSQNALLIYMLRGLGFGVVGDFFPSDGPVWLVPIMLVLALALNINMAYYFKRNNIYLRL